MRQGKERSSRSGSRETQMDFTKNTKGILKMDGKEARIQTLEQTGGKNDQDLDPDPRRRRKSQGREKTMRTPAITLLFWATSPVLWME